MSTRLPEASTLAQAFERIPDRSLLTAFLAEVPDFVHFKDHDGRALAVSRSNLCRNGLKRENEILGKTDFDFFSEQDARRAKETKGEVMRTGAPIYAAANGGQAEKIISLCITAGETGWGQLSVTDNGIGIPAENIEHIFKHGFTTNGTEHGFGLDCSANAAGKMEVSLTVPSGGTGTGTTFILDLLAGTAG